MNRQHDIKFEAGDAVEVVDGCGRAVWRGMVVGPDEAEARSGKRLDGLVPVHLAVGVLRWICPIHLNQINN